MIIHEHYNVFEEVLSEMAHSQNIPVFFLEKDYWLTMALQRLSVHTHRDLFVFKGGTSLSKAYGIIERFSEDVDLAIIAGELSGNQVRSRMKTIAKAMIKNLPELEIAGTTSKGSRFRRTAHAFPATVSKKEHGQTRPYILLEINAFGNPHPFQMVPLQSMIGQYLQEQGLDNLVKKYELEPFSLQVLKPERTFGEKVLAIVRASYAENPTAQLQAKVRHLYDLHLMMKSSELNAFMDSETFFETLRAVQADDARNNEFQGEWATHPLTDALIFENDDVLWEALEKTYTEDFGLLVYGGIPLFSEVRKSMEKLHARLLVFDKKISEND